jgi:lipoate-protein ligase A
MDQARLIDDPAREGSWNMAVDQALLASANSDGQVTLRFYRWAPATLSLGFFQYAEQRREHSASSNCPLVRRTTGGGAILHDRELTYSLCVPCTNRLSDAHQELYLHVHGALIEALRDWGIEASLHAGRERTSQSAPFLCFQRRSPGDIVLSGVKICGSAQRRLNAAILQHGSILISGSEHAPELPGVREASGLDVPVDLLQRRLTERLGQRLQLDFLPSHLYEREQFISQEIQQKQFAQHDWNYRR